MPDPTATLCPICRRPVPATAGQVAWQPFCSDRCKLIDLGRWLGDAYQIDVDESPSADLGDDAD